LEENDFPVVIFMYTVMYVTCGGADRNGQEKAELEIQRLWLYQIVDIVFLTAKCEL
jgi:hypothetical protein